MTINFDVEIKPSKHFRNTWMRRWNYDINDLRIALKEAYKIDKIGRIKYEAYTRYQAHGKSRKIIFVVYPTEIFIITGAEGT